MKLTINLIKQLYTDYVLVKNKAIYAVANTIKQFHIHKNMYIIYKQNLYNNKEKEVYYLFPEYLVPVMDDPDYPALIEEWKQNLDASYNEKIYTNM